MLGSYANENIVQQSSKSLQVKRTENHIVLFITS